MTDLELATTREELRAVFLEANRKLDDAMARPPRLLNEEQAAKYLSVSKGTLRNWRERNFGPRCIELDGKESDGGKKMIRYDIEDLDNWGSKHPRRKEIKEVTVNALKRTLCTLSNRQPRIYIS